MNTNQAINEFYFDLYAPQQPASSEPKLVEYWINDDECILVEPNQVVKVEFPFSENYMLDGESFDSIEQANLLLLSALNKRTRDIGYDKTDFVITFADGEVYKGRLDLCKTDYNLWAHIAEHLTFYGGLCCPSHMDFDKYIDVISCYQDDLSDNVEYLFDYIPSEYWINRINTQ